MCGPRTGSGIYSAREQKSELICRIYGKVNISYLVNGPSEALFQVLYSFLYLVPLRASFNRLVVQRDKPR